MTSCITDLCAIIKRKKAQPTVTKVANQCLRQNQLFRDLAKGGSPCTAFPPALPLPALSIHVSKSLHVALRMHDVCFPAAAF